MMNEYNMLQVKGAYVPFTALAALNLRSKGPQGPSGPDGPQGPPGPPGPPGSGGDLALFVNVKDYGALGNGTKDDKAAIQAALDYASTASFAVVQFPAGTYAISGTLYAPSGVALMGNSSNVQLGQKAVLKATGSFDMIKLENKNSGAKSGSVRIQGISFNGNNLATCAVRLDQNITVHVQYNSFLGFVAGTAAIKGGNNLYVHIDYNYFAPYPGAAIDLRSSLSTNQSVGYYGVNVGTISYNLIYSRQGTIVQGVVDILSNDIEGKVDGTAALLLGSGDAVGYPSVSDNYIELSAGGTNPTPVAIRFTSGSGRITGNRIYGGFLDVPGSIGIYPSAYTVLVDGNHIAGFDIGIQTDFTSPSFNSTVVGNDVSSCNTEITGISMSEVISTSGLAATRPHSSLIQVPGGGTRYMGAMAGSVVRYSYGTTIDLLRGNTFRLEFPTPTTITGVTNAIPGMTFTVGASNANVTLANSGFNLRSAQNYNLGTNEYLSFQVDHSGNVYELAGNTAGSSLDLTNVVSKAPDSATRNKIVPANTTSPAIVMQAVASQTAGLMDVYATDGTTKMLTLDKGGNLAFTRTSTSVPIEVYNNGNTTYAMRVSNGAPGSATAIAAIAFDGGFLAKSGTLSGPGLSFYSDPNTGLWSNTGDTIAVVTGGHTALFVPSTSRVAVGMDFLTPTYGLHQLGGGYRLQALSPSAPTVSATTTGSTSYYYFIVAQDVAGNYSLPSTGTLVANSAATPNNLVTWTQVKSTATYYVLRHTSPTISGTGNYLVGTVVPVAGGASSTFTDTNAAPTSFAVPSRNATADATIDGSLSVAGGKFAIDNNGYGAPRASVFLLAQGSPLVVGTNVTSEYIIDRDSKIVKAFVRAKTAPTGAAATFDINVNGVSIWNTTQANRLKLTAGTQYGTATSFDTINVAEGDIISVDVDTIGSTLAGQDVTVQLLTLSRN